MKRLSILLLAALMIGCSSSHSPLPNDADRIQIRTDAGFDADQCNWLGDVTGSEGYWFSSWLIPNDKLILRAVNELKTHAHQLGGDTVTLDYRLLQLFQNLCYDFGHRLLLLMRYQCENTIKKASKCWLMH
ncbi:DUF4156 domain-containing protein [Vibrio ordalii]|uniref:DUF4156 domain-containing protein n=1 Tax=Vibrio ordalii TaxID=28174 RepID=UPI0002482F22|nr:DUF4156 domain-containing protein [Vibrio ordalii]